MGAIAALTLNDGATTPVAHTFSPRPELQSAMARWVDTVGGISLGYPTITLLVRPPSKGSRVHKVSLKVVTPILEITSPSTTTGIQPAPTLAYPLIAMCDFILPERASLQQRKDLFAFFKNMLANAVMTSAVHDLEPVY